MAALRARRTGALWDSTSATSGGGMDSGSHLAADTGQGDDLGDAFDYPRLYRECAAAERDGGICPPGARTSALTSAKPNYAAGGDGVSPRLIFSRPVKAKTGSVPTRTVPRTKMSVRVRLITSPRHSIRLPMGTGAM